MSVFIIDPLRTECLVLHNQHFPIAGFFSPPNCHSAKLGFCTVLIRELTSHVPDSPSVRGSQGLGLCRVSPATGSFLGALLPLGSRERTPWILAGGGCEAGSLGPGMRASYFPLCTQQGGPCTPQQVPDGRPPRPPTSLLWGLGMLGAPDLARKTDDFSPLPVLSPTAAKYF